MKIVIIGGTGLIGSPLTHTLKDQYDVLAASPNTGVNTITQVGLEEALQNATVVIDVSNSPSFATDDVMAFFKTSTENLLAAEKKAGVQHHVILSVVGTHKLQESGYFRAKQVQEDLVKASGIPFSIIRATQFFEFAAGVAHMSAADGKIVLPRGLVQPIASADVVSFLAQTATGTPTQRIVDIAGPERFEMDAWIRRYFASINNPQEVVTDANAVYSGAAITATTLVPDAAGYVGSTHYEEWISKAENQR